MEKVIDYAGRPADLFLRLAEMSHGNERLRRVWMRNYLREINR